MKSDSVARLRQVAIATEQPDNVLSVLQAQVGLTGPWMWHEIGTMGHRSALFGVGDTFVEVVCPFRSNGAVARFLEQHGEGIYWLIFQISDVRHARNRAAALGIRELHAASSQSIAFVHLHPLDAGVGMSLAAPAAPGTWPWAGSEWVNFERRDSAASIAGAKVTTKDPVDLAERWAALLDATTFSDGGTRILRLDDGAIEFLEGPSDVRTVFLTCASPDDASAGSFEVAGLNFERSPRTHDRWGASLDAPK